jgi:xanthine dehydrogenase YagR molybdenum-binding subunit
MSASGSSIGAALSRVDGVAKVTGAARYAAEFNQPGQLHGVIIGSTIASGRIIAIESEHAAALPGVVAVLSHLNVPRLAYRENRGFTDPAVGERLHVFEDAQVRYFGQPVAVVLAEQLEQAEHAAAAVQVRYESQAADLELQWGEDFTIVPEAARRPGGRIQADTARGDADAALARAPVRIDARYSTPRQHHNPMEPHATIALWEAERLTLYSKSQYVVNEAAEIAAVFGLPPGNVKVISPFVGGAFGTSLRTWPHVIVAALAARCVGRPVKLVLSRRQMFHGTGRRPLTRQRLALGATHDGRLTALIHEGAGETSRYEQFIEALTQAANMMYSCAHVRTRYRLRPLDVSTPNHMRGPGEASGLFALECALDELAVALRMDPIELRLRNEPTLDESNGRPFSSRSLRECYRLGAERFGWQRRAAPATWREGRLAIGWGVAAATYPAHRAATRVRARLLPDGTAEVETAASDMGPGTYTSMTQIAADALGLPPERVHFRLGQSDYPPAPPHGGSQTASSVGSAVHEACLAVRELAAQRGASSGPVEAEVASAGGEERQRYSMHSFGVVFVEVAVDLDLASVRVRRALGVYAVGRIINPKLARSQCIGGMVGGTGMALMEQTVIDARDGRAVNASLADYLVPVNLDAGSLDAEFVEEHDAYVNPLGVKGLGEVAFVGMAPAIANAIYHATGQRVRDLPIRIESLLRHA